MVRESMDYALLYVHAITFSTVFGSKMSRTEYKNGEITFMRLYIFFGCECDNLLKMVLVKIDMCSFFF